MRVALVKVPATYATWHARPALGICYLAAVMEKHGIDVKIFDSYYEGQSAKQLVTHLFDYNPDLIGVTAMTHEVSTAAKIISQVKKTLACKVVIGGPNCTALPERTLREFPFFDFGIYGEGEKPLLDLVEKIANKEEEQFSKIEGLVFRRGNGQICINRPSEFLTADELKALPFPAFHKYHGDNPLTFSGKNNEYPIITSRGCPFKCSFCMRVLGNKIRRRTAQNVVQEIEYAISQYGAHTFNMVDELFLSNTSHTRQLLQMIIDERLNRRIRWRGLTRADFVNQDLVSLAKESGCIQLDMGVESGNNEILKSTNKGITLEQIRKSVEIIKKAGIYLVTYYIIGHPGEKRDTIQDTMRLAAELNTDHIAVGIMVPYPGTRIYEMARLGQMGYKLLNEHWSSYDKYGGKALEIEGLPYNEMVRFQQKIYLNFYLKNYRFKDLFVYTWSRRSAIVYFAKRRISKLIYFNRK